MKIEAGKRYRTRDGRIAIIYTTAHAHPQYPIAGAIGNELVDWTESGRFGVRTGDDDGDLVAEVAPYDELEIDEPVIVWDDPERKYRRHFAGVDERGVPQAWGDGGTSHTTKRKSRWLHCIAFADYQGEEVDFA
jgi:hypothetical protein